MNADKRNKPPRSTHPPDKRPEAAPRTEQRTAVLRHEAESQRRRTLMVFGVGVAAVVVIVAAIVVGIAATDEDDATSQVAPSDLAQVSGVGAQTPPPWSLPADAAERAQQAGLSLGPMGTADHYHAHLDVIVNGRSVPVPANLGVDDSTGAMSALHTHTPDGIIHVEAATRGDTFTLGQLFTEWNVHLSDKTVGSLRADENDPLTVYVNGQKYEGNPAMLQIADLQQIALVYGDETNRGEIPDNFDFSGV